MKIGRNDPCPCGSGKKYKKCCLSKDEAAARQTAQEQAAAHRAARELFAGLPTSSPPPLPELPSSLPPLPPLSAEDSALD